MLNHYDLAVIGLGPGGLVACLEAAKAGKQVVAFTDRTTYTRGQRVRLDMETSDYLETCIDESDPSDAAFYKILTDASSVQVKDLERFFWHKIQKFVETGQVKIVSVERSQRSDMHLRQMTDGVNIHYHGQDYHCQHILAADGVQRNFAALMNKELGTKIQFAPVADQPRYQYHAALQLRLQYSACQKLLSSSNPMGMSKIELEERCAGQDTCIAYHGRYYYFSPTATPYLSQIPAYDAAPLAHIYVDLSPDIPMPANYKELSLLAQNIPERAIEAIELKPSTSPFMDLTKTQMSKGWRAAFTPYSYCVYNQNVNKFFIAGEIPKIIFDESDPIRQREMGGVI